MAIIFAIWAFLGLIINGMNFFTLSGNVSVGTSAYLIVGNLIWIGGMVLLGFGAMFPRTDWSPGLIEHLLPGGRKKIEDEKDRREGVFRPHGMVGDTPYRVLSNGETDALMQGGIVRFKNLDHLRSMTNAATAPQTGNGSRESMLRDQVPDPASAPPTGNGSPESMLLSQLADPTKDKSVAPAQIENKTAWWIIVGLVVFILVALITASYK